MAKPETRIINKFENPNFTDSRQKKKVAFFPGQPQGAYNAWKTAIRALSS
ncbi:MAG: hypothetical protein ACOCPS_02690 [Desulfonatronovibrio sp.]